MLFSTENDLDIGDNVFGNKSYCNDYYSTIYDNNLEESPTLNVPPVIKNLALQQVQNLSPKNKMGIYISSINELKNIYGDSAVEAKYQQLLQRTQNIQLPKINCTYLYLVALLKKGK